MPVSLSRWEASAERNEKVRLEKLKHQSMFDACVKIAEHMLMMEGKGEIVVRVKDVSATHARSHESKAPHVQFGMSMMMQAWDDNNMRWNYDGPNNYIWCQEGHTFIVKGERAVKMGLTKQERVASIIIEEVAHALCAKRVRHGYAWRDKCRELFKKYLDYIVRELPIDKDSFCNGCEKEAGALRSGCLCIPVHCSRRK